MPNDFETLFLICRNPTAGPFIIVITNYGHWVILVWYVCGMSCDVILVLRDRPFSLKVTFPAKWLHVMLEKEKTCLGKTCQCVKWSFIFMIRRCSYGCIAWLSTFIALSRNCCFIQLLRGHMKNNLCLFGVFVGKDSCGRRSCPKQWSWNLSRTSESRWIPIFDIASHLWYCSCNAFDFSLIVVAFYISWVYKEQNPLVSSLLRSKMPASCKSTFMLPYEFWKYLIDRWAGF